MDGRWLGGYNKTGLTQHKPNQPCSYRYIFRLCHKLSDTKLSTYYSRLKAVREETLSRQPKLHEIVPVSVSYPPTNPPDKQKRSRTKKTSDSKQLQVTMNNSKKLQVTTTNSIKALRSKQPCNNPAENHSRAAAE